VQLFAAIHIDDIAVILYATTDCADHAGRMMVRSSAKWDTSNSAWWWQAPQRMASERTPFSRMSPSHRREHDADWVSANGGKADIASRFISSFSHNARKRARRKDVKAIVAELQKPAKEKLATTIEANLAWATEKLMSIASAELDLLNIKASDKIRAIEVLAKMHGWNALEKPNLRGELKIERIERIIVEPKNRDGGVPPPAGKGEI
jgi:hypothetical protein